LLSDGRFNQPNPPNPVIVGSITSWEEEEDEEVKKDVNAIFWKMRVVLFTMKTRCLKRI
jgi:hypothetical protein